MTPTASSNQVFASNTLPVSLLITFAEHFLTVDDMNRFGIAEKPKVSEKEVQLQKDNEELRTQMSQLNLHVQKEEIWQNEINTLVRELQVKATLEKEVTQLKSHISGEAERLKSMEEPCTKRVMQCHAENEKTCQVRDYHVYVID
jgi:hypothetical protein